MSLEYWSGKFQYTNPKEKKTFFYSYFLTDFPSARTDEKKNLQELHCHSREVEIKKVVFMTSERTKISVSITPFISHEKSL